jgi:hypothetical protein
LFFKERRPMPKINASPFSDYKIIHDSYRKTIKDNI